MWQLSLQLSSLMLLLLLTSPGEASAQCSYELREGTGIPGCDGWVGAAALLDEENGASLYLGGYFTRAGNVLANGIVKWEPLTRKWSPLGTGITGIQQNVASVLALTSLGGRLYVGGYHFTRAGGIPANSIASWDPVTASWAALGEGLRYGNEAGTVETFAVSGGKLFVGGYFATAGDVTTGGVACWDPVSETWSGLNGGVNGTVVGIAVIDGRLYAAGYFSLAGGVQANYVACWNPGTESWSPLGSGLSGYSPTIQSVAALNGKLYVGGTFTEAGGVPVSQIACWDPATGSWSDFGPHTENLELIGEVNGRLYGKLNPPRLARWDETTQTWSPLGSGIFTGNSGPLCVAAKGDDLYVGGGFGAVGGLAAMGIASWSETTQDWSALATGFNGAINSLALLNGDIYAAGEFTNAGAAQANLVARRDMSTGEWSRVGGGTDAYNYVKKLFVLDGELYAAGQFGSIGGVQANSVARWNPLTETWAPLSNGLRLSDRFGYGYAVAELNGKLFFGGYFASAGPVPASNIAEWDPKSKTWRALANGVDYGVYALASLGGQLYVGGGFTKPHSHIARWDPMRREWAGVGGGMDTYGSVRELLAFQGKLYAAGDFKTAGGIPVHNAAVWDPASETWSPWSEESRPFALTTINESLYADLSVNPGYQMAKWDATSQSWLRFGPIFQWGVSGVLRLDNTWYAGGGFATVDGYVSSYFAEWTQSGPGCPHDCDLLIWADADHDDDVDQADFGVLQRCLTGTTGPIPSSPEYPCICFDRSDAGGIGLINEADVAEFIKCVSGPAVSWSGCQP